ncbi:MAG: hypothetical protein WDA71_07365 [Actinomycetota bacterium]
MTTAAALLGAATSSALGLLGRVKKAAKRAQEKNAGAGARAGRQDPDEEGEEYSLDWLHAKESVGLAGRPEEDPDWAIPKTEEVADETTTPRATPAVGGGLSAADIWGEDLPQPTAHPSDAELTAADVWGEEVPEQGAQPPDPGIAAADIWGEDLREQGAQPLDAHDLAESIAPGLTEPQGFEPVSSKIGAPISLEQALDLRIRFERARLGGDQPGMEAAALALDGAGDPRALRDLILTLAGSIMRREEILEAILRYPRDRRASEAGKLSELPAEVAGEISRP